MRKLIVTAALVAFGVYLYEVTQRDTLYDLPDYGWRVVSLTGGKTSAAWEHDTTFQRDHLLKLEHSYLQPPAEGLTVGGRLLPGDHPLKAEDYRALLASGLTEVKLRDPQPLYGVERHNLRLRDSLPDLGLMAGEPVNKAVIDRLITARRQSVSVVGGGAAVDVQAGTILMVWVIFLGLVNTLRGQLWEPVLKLLDERNRELEAGQAAAKANRGDEEKLEREMQALRVAARRQYLEKLSKAQFESMKEADGIVNSAKAEARQIRDRALDELRDKLGAARRELEPQVGDLARQIVAQVLGRPPRAA